MTVTVLWVQRVACGAKEAVVRRYLPGVNLHDRERISSCFAERVELRDMHGISRG